MFRKIATGALASVSALALILPAAPPAFADAPGSGDPGIARISDVAGNVSVHRTDVDGTSAAATNAPVTVGDYIETQSDGRGEIEFDHATVVRLAPATQVRFTHLTPTDHEVQLAQGTVEMRLFHDAGGHPVVETPSADVRPDEAGRYRVTVDAAGNTVVAVRSGHVDVVTQGGFATQTLGAGQAVEIAGIGRDARFRDASALAYDSFDGYCDGRDGNWSRVSDYSYSDAGMVGEADLSAYGSWVSDPQYGNVWTPSNVAVGWSPYSDGNWVWGGDYGWTWVGNERWGYAPYHYGRWFRGDRDRWCWQPGRADYGSNYSYRPAVVGFFGIGAGIGLSFAIGNIGWVPLAPGEDYNPWWGGRDGYGRNGYGGRNRNTYVVNNTYNYYRNARYPGAAIVVSGRDFAAGRFGHPRRLYGRNDFAHAVGFRGVIPVVPTSRNLAFRGRFVATNGAPRFAHGFARMAAPVVVVAAFAHQRSTVATLARKQYPTYAPSVSRQVTASGRGAGFTRTSLVGVAHPGFAHPALVHPTVWNRFGGETAAKTYGRTTRAAYGAPGAKTNAYVAPKAGRTYNTATHTYSASTHRYAPATTYKAPGHTGNASAHTYTAPVHTYTAPVHRYTPTTTYHAPAAHTYTAPVHTYTAPVHTYTAPIHRYTPTTTYHAPAAHTYTAPVHTYTAPVHTYTAPVHTYHAPPTVVHTVTHVTQPGNPPPHPHDDHHPH